MAGSLRLATVLLMCMFVAQPFIVAEAAVTCGTVAGALRPCISYLQNGGAVPAPCCGGVRSLLAAATTPKDRQTACNCLKTAAGSIKGISLSNAAGLPRACGVNIPYAISPNTNCATVK